MAVGPPAWGLLHEGPTNVTSGNGLRHSLLGLLPASLRAVERPSLQTDGTNQASSNHSACAGGGAYAATTRRPKHQRVRFTRTHRESQPELRAGLRIQCYW